jgi:hypothetical protein
MMRFTVCASFVMAMSFAAAAQDDERSRSLKVVTKLKSGKIEFSGTVKMPDETALDVYVKREYEMLLYGKVECRIQPTSVQTPDKGAIVVRNGKFSGSMAAGGPGFYRLEIMYSRFSQRNVDVVKTLGNSYMDWARDFPLALLDGKIVEQLTDERKAGQDILQRLYQIRDMCLEMIKLEKDKRDFKPIDRELKILEKKIAEIREKTLYAAAIGVAADVAVRLRSLAPTNKKLELPPGIDPAHYEAEAGDQIMGLSDERDIEIISGFISRVAQTLDRERFLFTYRLATAEWDGYMRAIRSEADDATLAEAQKRWEASMEGVRENSKAIESELPRKSDRKANDELLAALCQKCNEMMVRMDGYATKRHGAKSSSNEAIAEMEEKEGKEVLQEWEKLDNMLRRVASK